MKISSDNPFIISKTTYKGVIFDLDGVVTKTAQVHAAAWKELFDEYLQKRSPDGHFNPFDLIKDYGDYVDGKPRYDGVKDFLNSRDIALPQGSPKDSPDRETICGLGNRKNMLFQEYLNTEGVEVYTFTITLIHQLREKGLKTAIVSSSKNCAAVLDAAHITELFEVKVDGNDAESLHLKGKPDPDIFVTAAQRLGLKIEECVVVEDAVAGVQAGSKGGFGLVIGVDRIGHADQLAEKGADVVVADLSMIKVQSRTQELPSALSNMGEIEKRLRGRQVALFLDYDGTLSPIVPHPEDAFLAKDMRNTLLDLAGLCTVAIISGRDLQDVRERVGIENLFYAGSHGFDMKGPQGGGILQEKATEFLPDLDKAEEMLKEKVGDIEGAQVERKKFSIALHYRNVHEKDVKRIEEGFDEVCALFERLRKTRGKKIFELQPAIDWDKGKALLWFLDFLGLDHPDVIPLYIGDDVTDEDAFKALKEKGIGILVAEDDKSSEAAYRLHDTGAVQEFFQMLILFFERKDSCSLIYKGFDPAQEGLRESLCALGNGYLVTRGAAPECDADGIHYPGTYLACGYNRLKTEIAGRIIENEDLVNIPNWLSFKFRMCGDEWFTPQSADILYYRQHLDMKEGVLTRTIRFQDKKGRRLKLIQRCLVYMENRHLAAMESIFTAENWTGMIEVRSGLDGRVLNCGVDRYKELSNKHLEPLEAHQIDPTTIFLKMKTNHSDFHISQCARVRAYEEGKQIPLETTTITEPGYIAHQFSLHLTPMCSKRIEKIVSLFTSRDKAISECGMESRRYVANAGNFNDLLQKQRLAWKYLWDRFGLAVEPNNSYNGYSTSMILHLYTFHLLQTISMHSMHLDVSAPSRGWHGEAYRGHIFWDELFIFPFLNMRVPEITRSLLMYRYRRLDYACRAAQEAGYKGAMYPWQSGSNGREESQIMHLNPLSGDWIPDHTYLQRHVNAAIVYNIWQYYQVTGDLQFLSFYGAMMILHIARFWSSLTTYNKELDRYEILGVIGPDEYHDRYPDADDPGLNNNAYTNIMAVFVLNRALDLFRILPDNQGRELRERLDLQEDELNRWRDITRKMRLIFHDDGIISQFEGYDRLKEFDWQKYEEKYGDIQRLDRILQAENDSPNYYKVSKQADVLMLFYLFSSEQLKELFNQLGYDFEYATIPKNVNYYLKRTSNGSSLSRVIHSWVSARLDRAASWKNFQEALRTDIEDIQGGTTKEGIHLGAMAACVDLIQRGYTGLEVRGETLRFNPMLPDHIEMLKVNIHYRGHWLEVEISAKKLKVTALSGGAEPIRIIIKEKVFHLKPGESIEL